MKFTVQALPRQTFEGTVQQVRLQSTTNENVVNYTVVVSVSNPEKRLLPGMTARVEFLTDSAEDVLKVANVALRFKPSSDTQAAKPTFTRNRTGNGQRATGNRERSGASGTLYIESAEGTLQPIRVRTGITDGKVTEVRGRELKEGMKVIAGTAQPQSGETDTANPFQQNNQQQGGRRPGGF